MQHEITIDARNIDAVLFDLDGVITSTARTHTEAWKETFDRLLCERQGAGFEPFDVDTDYPRYVDGRLRQDGVEAFLVSRGIALPMGNPTESPGHGSVWAVGNLKNQTFRRIIDEHGVDVHEDAIDLLARLRRAGIAIGLVTASRNCDLIVARAGLDGRFDTQFDGNAAARHNLRGKPAPDTFLAAARALGAEPQRCAVFEDAAAGIQAAQAGGFRMAIAVQRGASDAKPEGTNAEVVVADLSQIRVVPLPDALKAVDEIARQLTPGPRAVFLDYDGTLTPIVSRPDEAKLATEMRRLLSHLAGFCPVAIVTGRGLAEIKSLVDLELAFIASHGLELQLRGQEPEVRADHAVVATIHAIAEAATRRLGHVPGLIVERKPFSVAIHYRLVAEDRLIKVVEEIERLSHGKAGVRLLVGKKVHEFRPDNAWDKGTAILALARRLDVPNAGVLYIGDDVTDEDAFRVLRRDGIGIAVVDGGHRTAATYVLGQQQEVGRFLHALAERLEQHEAGKLGA